jgi:hypothetical protein
VTFRPPSTTSLRVVPARLAGRSDSCAYRGPQIAAILLDHRGEDLQARSQRQFQQLRLRVDEQINQRQMAQRRFDWGNG